MTDFNLAPTQPTPESDWPGVGGELVSAQSLDPAAGGSYRDKPIWDVPDIAAYINRTGYNWGLNNYGELDDGVINFGFWANYEELANSYYVNDVGTDAFTEAFNADAFSPFNNDQKMLAREAIGLWDDLIAITFKETRSGAADITYGNTDTGGAQAYAYLPFGDVEDEFYEQFGFEEVGRLGGDVWIDGFVASNFFPVSDGYYAKTTMIHETGHALGLSHPGNYNAIGPDGEVLDPTYENQAEYAQDTLQYSIMSYFDGYETGAQYIDWTQANFAYPATPMVHDIAAIQRMYGADMTTRTGDNVYGFNASVDRAEFDFAQNVRPIVTIWDAGGNDTLDFSGWNTPSTIDLNPGAFSSGGGIEEFLTFEQVNANRVAAGLAPRTESAWAFYEGLKEQLGLTDGLYKDNIAIAYNVTIENAVGGGGRDVIIGNSANNRLTGNAGADLFELRTDGVSGTDRITDFSRSDVLATTKKIADSNNDGIITWKSGRNVMLDSSDGDQLALNGISGTKGLRYLGTADGEYFYGDAATRPVAVTGQKVYESKIGNDALKGSTATTDIFFFDTANAAPGQGNDTVAFGSGDLIVTTTALSDENNDGVIRFNDKILDLSGNGGTATFNTLKALEYDGSVVRSGVTYYVYSAVGSSVGLADVHF